MTRVLSWEKYETPLIVSMVTLSVIAMSAFLITPHYLLPAEDAIILHQYSKNLAETGAITYFRGGPHAEGATDFLWMVSLAIGYKLGVAPFYLSQILNVFSVLLMSVVLVRLSRTELTWWKVLALPTLVLFCPQSIAALEGFSVFPFGLLLASLALFIRDTNDVAAALSALGLCLLRPDGFVFAAPLIVVRLLQALQWRVVMKYILLFVFPGTLYFIWRWHYFGEVFPLPFLVKSSTNRFLGVIVLSSVRVAARYLLFTGLLVAVACRNLWKETTYKHIFISILLVPTLFYFEMRLDQNNADRFFFYLLVDSMILVALSWQNLNISKAKVCILAAATYILLLAYPLQSYLHGYLGRVHTAV